MLPKIIVASIGDRDFFLSSYGLSNASVMGYEGSEGKIDDLRHFINSVVNISAGSTHFGVVIWDADKLSPECQSVLLKPLEESSAKTCLYLIVSNENGLLPTVLSRCVVMSYAGDHKLLKEYWKSVLECFSKGPAKCLSLADELEKSEMVIMLEEIIFKLKSGLGAEVNINRLKILKLAIDSLSVIRYSNVNPKMTLANFLINSWRLIKVPTR